jgi:lysophospholipase L1-like esterase
MTAAAERGTAAAERGLPQVADAERADPHCLPTDRALELLAAAPWRRLAVIGDSLAEGVGDPVPGYPDLPWPERLRLLLADRDPALAYLNSGRRGLTSAQIAEEQLAGALAFAPDLACVLAGGNDTLSRTFDLARTTAGIDHLVGALSAAGAQPVLFTLMDFTYWREGRSPLRVRLLDINEEIRRLAEQHGALLVDMARHPASRERDMYSRDGIHPSMRAHAVIAAHLVRELSGVR